MATPQPGPRGTLLRSARNMLPNPCGVPLQYRTITEFHRIGLRGSLKNSKYALTLPLLPCVPYGPPGGPTGQQSVAAIHVQVGLWCGQPRVDIARRSCGTVRLRAAFGNGSTELRQYPKTGHRRFQIRPPDSETGRSSFRGRGCFWTCMARSSQ